MDSRASFRRWTLVLIAYWLAVIAAVVLALVGDSGPEYLFVLLLLAGVPLYVLASTRIKHAYEAERDREQPKGDIIQFPLYGRRITSDEVSAVHPGNRRPYTRKLG